MKRIAAAVVLTLTLFVLHSGNAGETESHGGTLAEALARVAVDNRYRLEFDGDTFSGPGLDRLLHEARAARFLLLGEEHGIAENPLLAAQLFASLASDGYEALAIEISPPMAQVIDDVILAEGIDGLRDLFAQPGGEPAFFGMAEEAALLAAVRELVPGDRAAFWGLDYEVGGDRTLLRLLDETPKPPAAEQALEVLDAAAAASWAEYAATGNPMFIFSFNGDPALVRAVRDAWPDRDDDTDWILTTLEETFAINRLWIAGENWASNQRRAQLLRANFLRYWGAETGAGHTPKIMAKLGANHMVRGRNMTQTFDLGSLLPELAATLGGHSFSVMIVPGDGALTAVLNPSNWTYEAAPAKDGYRDGIEAITSAAFADAFTLIDLRPLRDVLGSRTRDAGTALIRTVYGFDMLLVMSGSTAAAEFDHD